MVEIGLQRDRVDLWKALAMNHSASNDLFPATLPNLSAAEFRLLVHTPKGWVAESTKLISFLMIWVGSFIDFGNRNAQESPDWIRSCFGNIAGIRDWGMSKYRNCSAILNRSLLCGYGLC
jgi:hypothetical protein